VSEADAPEGFRSGFAAVVGRPNVGKSTLVNALVGGKVAITSDKPQTTRRAIHGVLNAPGSQVVFVDTPGYHKPRSLLGERLNEIVRTAWNDVDIALFIVDGRAGVGRGDERVAQDLATAKVAAFCVVNKVDVIKRAEIASALQRTAALGDFEEIIPVSARTGEQLDVLRDLLVQRMPEGPQYYPPGMRTDLPPPIFVAELVREKLLAHTREEIPHSIAVVPDEHEEREDGLLAMRLNVFVERDSQKGMVIGRGGSLLKTVGTEARQEVEVLFGRRVFLELRVKVERDWQRRAAALERLGIGASGG
jgi:GTP-binding protein Era